MTYHDPISNIKTEADLERWLQRWCSRNHIATVTKANGDYVDDSLQLTWKALSELFSERFKQNEKTQDNSKAKAPLNVHGMISFLSNNPNGQIALCCPSAHELDDDGNVYLCFKQTSKQIIFPEMQQTLEYLKGMIFRNDQNKQLRVTAYTPVYYEDYGGHHVPLERSDIVRVSNATDEEE